ncbi:MAG: hypothetical protein OXM02_14595 [Bacteroidota bacterium]|nr:hypothetical protein [Bacteroidota bacterium]
MRTHVRRTRRGSPDLLCAAVLMLVLGGCGSPQQSDPLLPVPSVEYILTEAFRIGDEAAGDTVLFGSNIQVAQDSRGQLYITDRQTHSIRLYSGSGERLGTIGRSGQGPGEFSDSPELYLGTQDTLYAMDTNSDRITVFSPGDHVALETIDISNAASFGEDLSSFQTVADLVGVTPEGIIVSYDNSAIPFLTDMSGPERKGIKLLDRNGAVLADTLYELPDRNVVYAGNASGVISTSVVSFGRDAFFVLSREHLLYYGTNEAIAVGIGKVGDPAHRTITVPHDPVPITAEERRGAIEGRRANMQVELRKHLPETKPAYQALIIDNAGRMWLQLSTLQDSKDADWIVVDPEGRTVATTTLPLSIRLQTIAGDRAVGVGEEDGAPVVIAYAITATETGGY